MKKIPFTLFILFSACLAFSIYFLDRDYFLSPISYSGSIVVRNDCRGNGFFGAGRNGRRTHQGIDLFGEIGTPVVASRSGIVVAAKRNPGMGNFVVIRHPHETVTIYGHLSGIKVKKGQFVRQGAVVGWVGKTGNANHHAIQPHLHFEVRKSGLPQEPLEYLE